MSFFRPLLAWLAIALGALQLGACAQLPSQEGRTVSVVDTDTGGTRLGRAVQALARERPGLTGIMPLADGHDAFAARATLAGVAERTLDIQYYIWRDDLSGSLMFDAVRQAADRGVRVRLLLDDNNTAGLDEVLRGLDAHPRIEVRLFNPFPHRGARAVDYFTDFGRVNRRMHNKSFTADNQVTVIGGRNIGDAYFAATGGLLFLDLDVLAVGEVVDAVSRDFDRYWASDSAYPLERLLTPLPADRPLRPAAAEETVAAYREAIARSAFVRDLLARKLPFAWGRTEFLSDDPAKVLGRAPDETHLGAQLQRAIPPAQREALLVSPYFVPTARGTTVLTGLAAQGVKVVVLTNALESTDVPAVHAGYARWREPLLAGGVELFELRRDAATLPVLERGLGGSSASSLHAKVFVLDRSRVYVGSFNFDPRSAHLNTENGLVIESAGLAERIAGQLADYVPQRAYRLRLHEGRVQWVEQRGAESVVHLREPNASWWLRAGVSLLSLLPIEHLL